MQWLDAILAFSITMLVLSMVTTTIVETIHRMGGLREAGLRLMMSHIYDQTIVPYLEKSNLKGKAGTDFEAFKQLMTKTLSPKDPKSDPESGKSGKGFWGSIAGFLSRRTRWAVPPDDMAHLDAEKFFQRLGSSPFGEAIESVLNQNKEGSPPKPEGEGQATLDPLEVGVKDIGRKFETLGEEASSYFERRARLYSVLIAFVVAWVFYVHPYDIMVTYLNKPEVTAKLIAQSEVALQQYSQQTDADKAAFEAATQQIEKHSETGVPLGWTDERVAKGGFHQFPICFPNIPVMLGLTKPSDGAEKTAGGAKWVFLFNVMWPAAISADVLWLLLGGFLIGLGAPFWARAVTSLTKIRGIATGKSAAQTDADKASENDGKEEYLGTLLNIFRSAREVKNLTQAKPDGAAT